MGEKLAEDGSGALLNYITENDLDGVGVIEHKVKNTGSLPKIPGYFLVAKTANRNSGGLCFYMKLIFKYKITKIRTKTRHNIMWIKIPAVKSGSTASKDLYLALVYCRTDNYEEEVSTFFSLLAHDSLMFNELGEILVMGDFNSRLGKLTKTLRRSTAT